MDVLTDNELLAGISTRHGLQILSVKIGILSVGYENMVSQISVLLVYYFGKISKYY